MTSTEQGNDPVSAVELEAARMLLARMGIAPQDLLRAECRARPAAPTFAEYVATLLAAIPDKRTDPNVSYWNRLVRAWGQRRITEPSVSDLRTLIAQSAATEVVSVRKNFRGGVCAERNMVAALRHLYARAEEDGLITAEENPARRLRKPRMPVSTRRALPSARLAEINDVAARTGTDPELDTLLLRLHVETGCRRGGALALRPCDLDEIQCLIRLREKGNTTRWQPVSPTLMRHLIAHVADRGSPREGRLLRTKRGTPISEGQHNRLWKRLGEHLPWVAAQGVSTHWLRHTTITWVERTHGHAVARAYAGHAEAGSGEGTTGIYTKATLGEVATALAALTGEPHPLADAVPDDSTDPPAA